MRLPRGEPAPQPCSQPKEREADRYVWCSRYDGCLDTALAAGWQGFSCRGCVYDGRSEEELAETAPPPAMEEQADEDPFLLSEAPPEDLGLAARVRELVVDGDRVSWSAQQVARVLAVDDSKTVARELARQANRGVFRRVAPGIYARNTSTQPEVDHAD